MGVLENMTPGQILLALAGLLLAAAGFVNTVGSALDKIAKAVKAVKAPNAAQDDRLDELETRMDRVENKLNNDHARFEGMDTGNRITQRALLALLDHGIDGNNIEQMQHAKEELQNHLINR